MTGAQSTAACRNCGAPIAGEYCSNCGQETRLELPTFRAFMREAAGRYIALDGRTWRTLWALVARPGFLTREYLQGRRRRYIRPARLFLVLYLLLFALIGFVQPPGNISDQVVLVNAEEDKDDAEEAKEPTPRASAKEKATKQKPAIVNADPGTLKDLEDLNFSWNFGGTEYTLPPQVKKRIEHFKALPKEEKAEQVYAGVLRFGTYAMVALLPAFALLMKIAYMGRGRKYPGRPQRYAEHLVYSAHLHAFAALVLILMIVLPWAFMKVALGIWVVYYVMRARQTVYRGRWWGGVVRALFVGTIYSVLVALAVVALLVAAIMLR